MLRMRSRGAVGFIEPCLPSPVKQPPAGPNWLHEIKHDGFRIMARRDGAGVRLVTRNGHDFTHRFPLAVAAVTALPARSFLIDGEAIVTNDNGLAVFELGKLVRDPHPGIVLNEHYEGDGEVVFQYARKLGCEGIVPKRLGSPYRSGRVAHWLKIKNPAAPAVTREAKRIGAANCGRAPLPASVDRRRIGSVLCRARPQRAEAGVY